MLSPCCCHTCLLFSDSYTRSNSSDINSGAPVTYTIDSGSWSIDTNRLTTASTNAKILFPEFEPEPKHNRTFQITFRGDTGSVVRFYIGDHYYEVQVGANGYIGLYKSDGTCMFCKGVLSALTAATNLTASICYGPVNAVSSNSTYIGAAITGIGFGSTYGCEIPCTGTSFGIGTGGTVSNVFFDTLNFYQNSHLKTGTGSCLAVASTCTPQIVPSDNSGTTLAPHYEQISGTWERSGGGFDRLKCTAAGKLEFIGGLNQIHYFFQRIDVQFDTYSQMTIGGDPFEFWVDDGDTGISATLTGLDALSADFDVEVWVAGSLQTTVVSHLSAFGEEALLFKINCGSDRIFFQFSDNNLVYDYVKPVGHVPTIVDACAGSADRWYHFVLYSAIDDFNLASFVNGNSDHWWTGTAGTVCTGSHPANIDLTFDDIAGTCSGGGDVAADVNGSTYRATGITIASVSNAGHHYNTVIDSCGVPAYLYMTTRFVRTSPTGNDRMFVVGLRCGNAWARFEKDYTSVPACNVLAGDDIPLVDFYNADGFDFTAATCSADAV